MNYISTLPEYAGLPRYAGVHDGLWNACDVLDDLTLGHPFFLQAQRRGAVFQFENLYPSQGNEIYFYYYVNERQGVIDLTWQGSPANVLAAALSYLCVRVAWDCLDSVHQEYTAYDRMAKVWKKVRAGSTHTFLDQNLLRAETGESQLKYWILEQQSYQDLPAYYP